METKKIIQINPALLKVSNKTRRRAPTRGGITASERSERSKQTSANLVKKQILNKIRQNYKGGVDDSDNDNDIDNDIPIHTDNDDFEASVKYFENLKKSMKPAAPVLAPASAPIIHQPSHIAAVSHQPQLQYGYSATPTTQLQQLQQGYVPSPMSEPKQQPQYGCLKGGSLPTYRNWQKTQKNPSYYTNTNSGISMYPVASVGAGSYYHPPSFSNSDTIKNTTIDGGSAIATSKPPTDWEKEKDRIHQIMEMRRTIENSTEVARNAAPTRKRKITRRTYHVGKSKIHPKVSVLLSNKTIRSQIMTEKQHYNEIPIQDIKQYLQKKGLIKIGSNSPAHVLRSMYESAMLLGGDIVNHNKDTLLHNFLKSGEGSS